ncbi:hypothetical protein KGF57_003118 [Candida theae]|uniref:BTB domain-containing protein n=1 Tax=Candida theae TaxID=1198502 RepID=A0AAD5BEI6_9ASCO|nr:uncharacterized protein KGF57_003118 [Candida theae]KAI5957851.1 hypothetical protein KGF57_003118 [Candida theae]
MITDNASNLKKITKDELMTRDVFGRTVLHVAILSNDPDSLSQLTKNPNFKYILQSCDYENGWNCMHYIIFYKRLQCFNVLIQYLHTSLGNLFAPNGALIELLKCKDRCGYTCMQLIAHDLSNVHAVPEYIDVGDEFSWKSRGEISDKRLLLNTDFLDDAEHDVEELDRSARLRKGSDVYVIGCNSNNQLGLGDSKDRSQPLKVFDEAFVYEQNDSEVLAERFCKPRFKKMVISKNHAAIITADGNVFTCGVGSRGRLGHGPADLSGSFKFSRVDFFHDEGKSVEDIAISNNHSVVLTSDGDVYAWGMNGFNQLGVNTPSTKAINSYLDDWIATPVLVAGELRKNKTKTLLGVDVSKIHSVTWSKNELYFWGLNVGQMGIQRIRGDIELKLHDESVKGEIQTSPRATSLRDEIKCVSTTELCTFVVTALNDIHVYYNYQHYKLPKVPVKGLGDKHFDFFKPRRLTEGTVITKIVTRGPDCSMVLLSSGSVVSFSLNSTDVKNTKYSTVWRPQNEDMKVVDFDIGTDGSVVLCTMAGTVFLKLNQSSQRRNSMSGAVLPISVNKNKFKKIENVNRIVQVTCDPKFLSFGFIRDEIDLLPMELHVNDFVSDVRQLSPMSDLYLYRKQDQLMRNENGTVDSEENEIDWSLKQTEQYLVENFGCDGADFDSENKLYDASIQLNDGKTVCFHKDLLQNISSRFNALVGAQGDMIMGKHFHAKWNSGKSCLEVTSPTKYLSVLLFVQSVYTGAKVDLWSSFGSRSRVPGHLKLVFDQFDELCALFQVNSGPKHLLNGFSNMLSTSSGSVKFELKDGETFAHAYILKVRSAFFETILSERWGISSSVTLDFTGLTKAQMEIILRHIYGDDDKDLLNCYKFKFCESDVFINEALEMIEIADELLLFQLKAVFEIAIAELVSLQNVLSLVVNADYISAHKLFLQCCWFIHHNLEVLLYDPTFQSIPIDIVEKIEHCFGFESFDDNEFCKVIPKDVSVPRFVSNLCFHNEYFMSDRKGFSSFEPLVDPRLEVKKLKEPTKRRRSRKSSTLNADIVDFRKNFAVENHKESPPVIEETTENEFIEVSKKSRSKSQTKATAQQSSNDLSPPPRDKNGTGDGKFGTRRVRVSSVGYPTDKPAQVYSAPTASPQLSWATSPPLTSHFKTERPVSKSPEPFTLMGNSNESKQFKPKMGPHVKLSQKERKKLAAASTVASTVVENKTAAPKSKQPDLAPWAALSTDTAVPTTSASFPALGATRVKSPVNALPTTKHSTRSIRDMSSPMIHANSSTSSLSSIYSTPSLAEVMRGESQKTDYTQEDNLPKRTLAEVQQEQEFEKWWQEESRKVQQEIGGLQIDNKKQRTKKKVESEFCGGLTKNGTAAKKGSRTRSNGSAVEPVEIKRKFSNSK